MIKGIERFSGRLVGQRKTVMRQNWRYRRFRYQNGVCFYCPTEMVLEAGKFEQHRLCTLDHRIPLSRGGMDHWENSAAACKTCNEAKGNMTETEFRAALIANDARAVLAKLKAASGEG